MISLWHHLCELCNVSTIFLLKSEMREWALEFNTFVCVSEWLVRMKRRQNLSRGKRMLATNQPSKRSHESQAKHVDNDNEQHDTLNVTSETQRESSCVAKAKGNPIQTDRQGNKSKKSAPNTKSFCSANSNNKIIQSPNCSQSQKRSAHRTTMEKEEDPN